jgi:tetratricopeptide (TPR) repeat protein
MIAGPRRSGALLVGAALLVGGTAVAAPAPAAPWDEAAFRAAEKLLERGRYGEALDGFVKLVPAPPTPPAPGVITAVLAALASMSPDAVAVARLTGDADGHPGDPLRQLMAGVGAHYCGHRHGRTRDEKARYYRLAIRYLERAVPLYEDEPRRLLYLAVSHHRLGEQSAAQALIERAVAVGSRDPDVFYCRAEVFQRVDLARSIADVERYLAMTTAMRARGFADNPEKHRRVEAMLAHLRAAARGEAPLDGDLWDPLPPPPPARHLPVAAIAEAAVLLAALALIARRWRARP